VTTTPSHKPYLEAEWLYPGPHITAVGADAPEKQEIEARASESVDLIACDLKSQSFVRGDLHHAREAASLPDRAEIVELGEPVNGEKTGRVNDEQITLCHLTGIGIQDTVIALLAYQKARARGIGMHTEISFNKSRP
jgi:ornithine cyclodeaminase/alanine dehydrogenase-like protein (mu-crystallin family)